MGLCVENGLTLFEMLTGNLPIYIREGKGSVRDKWRQVVLQHGTLIEEIDKTNLPCQLKALMRWLTYYDPSDSGQLGLSYRPSSATDLKNVVNRLICDFSNRSE